MTSAHVVKAQEFIAIAESGDSKREAYKRAADEIQRACVDDGMTQRGVATTLGKDESFIRALLRWRKGGFKAETPWLADEQATGRAALSHTRKTLREAEPEQLEEIVDSLPAATQEQLAVAASPERRAARDFAKGHKPSPARPSPTLAMADFARELTRTRTALKNALELATSVNQPGDDEDLLEDLERIIALAEAVKETYATGQSVDTWAAELAEG